MSEDKEDREYKVELYTLYFLYTLGIILVNGIMLSRLFTLAALST